MTATAKTLHSRGILLLVLTTVIWGTSFPLLKQTLDVLSPAAILAVRFTLAAAVFSPWLRQLNPRLLRDGAILGAIYFTECVAALMGLELISANRSAFIISLNVILVPLLGTALGQRISSKTLLAAGLAIAGIGIMSWEGGGANWGDVLTFGCAIGIAVYILRLGTVAGHHPTLPLVAVQLGIMAVLSIIWALPQALVQPEAIGSHLSTLLYLGLVVTATPIWTQAIAQRWVPAHEAALLYTLEPVFAALFSFWWLREALGVRGLIGAALILTATIFSQSGQWKQTQ